MHMNYWFGTTVGDLLFEGFTITSPSAVVMTCFGLASLSILSEAIKVYQAYIKHSTELGDDHCRSDRCTNERSLLLGNDRSSNVSYSHHKLLPLLRETGWYIVQDVLSYILMLCVMTYNGYFTIAVSVGAGVGYLVFGPVLLEIGVKSGGLRRPKRLCTACIEVLQNEEDTRQDDVTLPTVAQQDSLVHQSDQGHCQESVAVVHRADN
ncbi:probable low affinity copper uptake protein 2 [Zootermopsis nevadensis]|uniref:Copper transport protein n=1 Tax=Zootermopsis nevadensis TaxID=136037 RepID=A0A067RUJ8_ZOONE|nr:probable low affinity copper uptake protein 2 [Zootermopsis nevadensis]XP_021934106.1 probable low affinity copper uptake protein 2 [Zootermopsis nevadensis]XP_021934113.1 probable low affinity copper uptake protein 2 [Zootermopsis nevadensis]XP_021934124.1 probable low affinity copper uptake protein 2 [Zootermopsis nevadensis]KDR23514.1 High affinity copper uptake protein 1 [Zootermopsis nevadensis]